MIPQTEIQRAAKRWNVGEHIVEKDYVLGWMLWGIAQQPRLSSSWVLKGGSAIKKCYVDTHRYSQDLDFTVLPDGPHRPCELYPVFNELLERVGQTSGIDFSVRAPRFRVRPNGESCEGRIYYVGPRGNPSPTAVKLDITRSEDLMRPPVLRSISHPYSDSYSDQHRIYCYSLEELFAEKIRALGERADPSDLYDIIYLFRRSDLHAEPELISEVLGHKCDFKEVPSPQSRTMCTPEHWEEIRRRWEPMLGRAVSHLPSLDDFWSELPFFFAWLDGEDGKADLLPVSKDSTWAPPPLYWQRGQSEVLEPIRHAAVNRLLLNLGYGHRHRLVEPYSLRLTRAGNTLFYALKAQTREIRSYRVDRIQSSEVTRQRFQPVFRIEFTPEGRVPVPYTRRHGRLASSRSKGRYVVWCAVCGKDFYRRRYSTRMNPHRRKDSRLQCSGRHGYLV